MDVLLLHSTVARLYCGVSRLLSKKLYAKVQYTFGNIMRRRTSGWSSGSSRSTRQRRAAGGCDVLRACVRACVLADEGVACGRGERLQPL
jgi:hypothetical protein